MDAFTLPVLILGRRSVVFSQHDPVLNPGRSAGAKHPSDYEMQHNIEYFASVRSLKVRSTSFGVL